MSDQQIAQLGHRLARSMQAHAGRMVKAANRKSAAIQLATVLGAIIIGGLLSWLAFGKPANAECRAVDKGGVYCVYWLSKPPPS